MSGSTDERETENESAPLLRTPVAGDRALMPFMRTDAPMTWLQLLQAIPCALLLVPIRVATFFVVLLVAQLLMLWWRWTTASGCQVDVAQAERKLAYRRFFAKMARAMLFVLGFYHIEVEDERDGEALATGVIVSNHLSFLDVLVHCAILDTPSFVAKESATEVPLFGHFFSFMSCLLVPAHTHQRERGGDGAHTLTDVRPGAVTAAMVERQRCFHQPHDESHQGAPPLPPLVVFSEGTTSNGVCFLPFRSGAFVAGLPVTPVCISYPHSKFNLSWETIPTVTYLTRMLLQYRLSCTFHILPVYFPTQEEANDANLYAANVRRRMMTASGARDSVSTVVDKQRYHASIRRGERAWTERMPVDTQPRVRTLLRQ